MLLKNESIKLDTLKKLCKSTKLKYSKLKKQELLDLYNKYLAVKKIQKAFRTYLYKDSIDAITLESVSFPCFIYRTKSGKCHFYAYDSIIKYIMKTGVTKDPMTREEYSDNTLKRLDIQVKMYFPEIKYRSTYKIKINLNYARRIKNRENEILNYHMRIDELKEHILFIAESGMNTWDLPNEPILIENVEYRSIDSFIQSTFHELKIVLNHLMVHDTNYVNTFKSELMETVSESFKFLVENL
jgi:hypothetical protein